MHNRKKEQSSLFRERLSAPLYQTVVLLRFVIIQCIAYIYSASNAVVAILAMIVSFKHHIIAKYLKIFYFAQNRTKIIVFLLYIFYHKST